MKKSALILLLMLITATARAQDTRTTAAVMDLEAQEGFSQGDGGIISDYLRTQLANSDKYVIVTRENMEQILKEQNFQMSGCTSEECIVKIGQILSVRKIFAGSIGKLGSTYVINLKIIDIESGRTERAVSEQCPSCEIDGLLTSVENIAAKATKPQPVPAAKQPHYAFPADRPAGKFELSVSGGFTTVQMKQMNGQIGAFASMITGSGGTILDSAAILYGFPVEVEAVYAFFPGVKAGIKAGYIFIQDGTISGNMTPPGLDFTITYSATLVPVMLGGRYSFPVTENLDLGGSLFAGIGSGSVVLKEYVSGSMTSKFEVPYSGSAFCGEFTGECEYFLTPQFSVTGSFGWRSAVIPQMAADKDVDADNNGTVDFKKGDILKDLAANEDPIEVDFSGLSIAAGVKIIF